MPDESTWAHTTGYEGQIDDWCDALRDHGCRITSTRRQLVSLILRAIHPVTANGLFEEAKSQHLHLGLATIYRTLETLEKLGLLQRVHDNKGCHSYVPAESPSLVAVCQACGHIDVLEDSLFHEALAELPTRLGYQVHEITVQVRGICASCR